MVSAFERKRLVGMSSAIIPPPPLPQARATWSCSLRVAHEVPVGLPWPLLTKVAALLELLVLICSLLIFLYMPLSPPDGYPKPPSYVESLLWPILSYSVGLLFLWCFVGFGSRNQTLLFLPLRRRGVHRFTPDPPYETRLARPPLCHQRACLLLVFYLVSPVCRCVQKAEHDFFRKILPQYYEHHRTHPDSVLTRFCGMYLVKNGRKKIPFIVMKW